MPSPHPHQRARCLKFSPSLPTIQINNRRNAEEAYCVGKEEKNAPSLSSLANREGVKKMRQREKDEAISRFTNKIGKAFEC